jgi:Sec-independent protein translocase protein TatA
MFAMSRGELAIVLFIFALVWGAAVLPRLGERIALSRARRGGSSRGR